MIILPYVSSSIGIEAYGYIGLGNNIVSYIDLIASTVNVYAVKFVSIEWHTGNVEKANEYFNSIVCADIFICLIIFIPALFGIWRLDSLLNVPQNLVFDVRMLFLFMLICYQITILGTAFTAAAFVRDELSKAARIDAVSKIIKGLTIIILFFAFSPHVWYVSLASMAAAAVVLCYNVPYSLRSLPQLRLKRKCAKIPAVAEIVKSGIWNTFSSLGTTLNSGLDLFVTNLYLGALEMGQISVPKTLSGFVTSLLTAISNAYRPQLLQYYTHGEEEKLIYGFHQAMKMCGMAVAVIFSVFFAFGESFLTLWLPNENVARIYRLAVMTFMAETLTGVVKPLHYACVLTNKLKVPCMACLMVGVANVVSMVVLLNTTDLGIYAVALTTVVGNVGYYFIIMPLYASMILGLKKSRFYGFLFRYVLSVFAMVFAAKAMTLFLQAGTWGDLMICLALAAIVSAATYFLLMFTAQERKSIVNLVRSRMR